MTSKPFRVLLIDDDEDDFVNIRALFSELPGPRFEVIWSASYREGLEKLRQGAADVCLLDYRLGEKSGLDLLQAAHLGATVCPVILLTGQGDFEVDVKAMQAGAADYLVKSQLSAPLLERAIRYAIKRALDLQEITEQKENFQTLFHSTFEGILVLRHRQIVDANRAATTIFKLPLEKIVGFELTQFIGEDLVARIEKDTAAGGDARLEAAIRNGEGFETPVQISSRRIRIKDQWAQILTFDDLSQRKEMEAQIVQQDRLASLGLLASSLAHEIGTPLGVIRGRAELAMRSSDEKTRTTMELIVSQIDRIAKLVQSLLHLARSPMAGSPSEAPLKPILDDVLNLIRHELDRRSIKFEAHLSDAISVRAEPGPLGQVFLNLLVNSIHALESRVPGEHKKISLETRLANSHVEVAIHDTGSGISPVNMRRLFQPFFTTKEIGQGTGLGLATSLKIVRHWGGDIRVESREGEGSTFTVILRR